MGGLVERFWECREEVEGLLDGYPIVPYSSADVRDCGERATVVDVNVFPAGFNNLPDPERASELFDEYFESLDLEVERVGIVPEAHTKNTYYFENLFSLREMVRGAGVEAEVVTPDSELLEAAGDGFEGAFGNEVRYLSTGEFDSDVLLMNNDLSNGALEGLDEGVPVLPPQEMGWWRRSKGEFFSILEERCREVAAVVGVEPWRLFPETRLVRGLEVEGDTSDLADAVEGILEGSRSRGPGEVAAFVKDDRGTYGQGTVMLESSEEAADLNSKQRKSLARGKGGHEVTDVIVQEGIPTRFSLEGEAAEPVQYVVGGESAGYFWRCRGSGELSVLNSPGQSFREEGPELGEREEFLHASLARLGHAAAAEQAERLSGD